MQAQHLSSLTLDLLRTAPCLSVFLFFIFLGAAQAQTIELDPMQVTVADADEFFTDVWGTPKNFNSPCHVGDDNFVFNPDFSQDGIWTGVSPFVTAPTMGIVPIPTLGTPLVYREDCTQLGLQHPIDANKYTQLSYRAQLSQSELYSVLWSKDRIFALNGASNIEDGFRLPPSNLLVQTPANEWALRSVHLPDVDTSAFPWSGSITGVTLIPNVLLPSNSTTKFDWLRLIDPDSSPSVNLSWNTTGPGDPNLSAAIYFDTDTSGFDGIALVHGRDVSGTYTAKTGLLPPGTYYAYAQLESSAANTFTVVDRSSYVGPIVIQGKPILTFSSPSRMSGAEFSRDERLDAWDMNEASDVVNFNLPPGFDQAGQRGFHDPVIDNGIFIAESDFDPFGAAQSVDTGMVLAQPNGMTIDTSKYRYYCHRSQLDSSAINRSLDNSELDQAGFVTRLIFTDAQTGTVSETGGHQSIEKSTSFPNGLTTYCMDLWDDSVFEGKPTWRSFSELSGVRFDPLESRDARKFAVDFVGLYAENIAQNGMFRIAWTSSDPENDSLTVSLFYDTDRQGFNGTPIATIDQAQPGSMEYIWDTTNVANGSYFIYALVSDGVNESRFYSEVAVNIGSTSGLIAEELSCDPNQPDCIFEELDSTACVGANGFLNQVNIATVINRLATPLSVNVQFLDSAGVLVNSVTNVLEANRRFDYLINELGLLPDTIGTVCVIADGPAGSWNGGLAVYKPDFRNGTQGFGEAFDFALYYPFLNPRQGRVSVPLNTFHLGTAAGDTVANWISISDAVRDGTGLSGVLRFYNRAGILVEAYEVGIPDGGRGDFSGHDALVGSANFDAIGLAEFSPKPGPGGNPAKFYMSLTRYFYDCAGQGASCLNFRTAFNIPFRPGTSSEVAGGVATNNDEFTVIELINSSTQAISTDVNVFAASGNSNGPILRGVPSRGNLNVIVNKSANSGFLEAGEIGSSIVSSRNGSLQAFSIFYKLSDVGALEYAYAAPFTGTPGQLIVVPFNSFIKQKNSVEIFNAGAQTATIQLEFTDYLGVSLRRENISLSPKNTFRLADAAIPADTYGTVSVQSNVDGLVLRNYTSRDSSYTIPFTGQ
jgi:hypothetical protein